MSRHTEGPWSVFDNGIGRTYVASENGTLICFIESDDENVDSDADLIAAAPDLLAELEMLSNVVEGCGMTTMPEIECRLLFARAAIAKATGK